MADEEKKTLADKFKSLRESQRLPREERLEQAQQRKEELKSRKKFQRPAEIEKITAADLEARFEARKRRRDERPVVQRTPAEESNRRKLIAAGGILLLSLMTAIGFSVVETGNHNQLAQYQDQYAKIQNQLDSVGDQQKQIVTTDQAKPVLEEVAKKSKIVADLQTQLLKTPFTNGAPDKIQSDLGNYFTKETVASNDLDPRNAWFMGDMGKYADSLSWKTGIPTYTDGQSISQIWELKNGDGQMIAWTTAHYDATSGRFMDVASGTTSVGDRLRTTVTNSKSNSGGND